MSKLLYILRHPESESFENREADITDEGRQQYEDLAKRIALESETAHVLASPAKRAMSGAHVLAGVLHCSVEAVPIFWTTPDYTQYYPFSRYTTTNPEIVPCLQKMENLRPFYINPENLGRQFLDLARGEVYNG